MRIKRETTHGGQPAKGDTPPGKVPLSQWTDPDWRADLRRLIASYGMVRARDTRQATGQKTTTNRRQTMERIVSLLQARNRSLKSLSQLKPRHIPEMVQTWDEAGVAKNTQVQYYSVLRWFWRIHGIEVGTIKQHVAEPDAYIIRTAAQFDRSITAQAPDPETVFAALGALDQRMRLFAQLAYYAGLRKLECMCLDPHASDLGDRLKITKGAKGGRPRIVDLTAAGDEAYARVRAALDELKQITRMGDRAGWPGMTLQQAERRFEYLADKAGVTKKALGATFHGFRHDYAIATLQHLTGQLAPVRGGMVLDYQRLRDHQLNVSQQLGHNRTKVTNAYYGSFAAMKKRAQNNFVRSWEMLQPHLQTVAHLLQADGIDNLYLVGARAMGMDLASSEPFQLQLPHGLDDALAAEACRTIGAYLTQVMEVPVSVSPDLCTDDAARAELMKRSYPLFAPKGDDGAQQSVEPNPSQRPARPQPLELGVRARGQEQGGLDLGDQQGDQPHQDQDQVEATGQATMAGGQASHQAAVAVEAEGPAHGHHRIEAGAR